MDLSGAISDSRLIPSGVISNAHDKIKRDRKPGMKKKDDQPHRPVWDFEKWKDLRGDLNEQPGDDGIGDRDLVNIAPFQLGEEVAELIRDEDLSRDLAFTRRSALKQTCFRMAYEPKSWDVAAEQRARQVDALGAVSAILLGKRQSAMFLRKRRKCCCKLHQRFAIQ